MSRGACILLGISLAVLPIGFAWLVLSTSGPEAMRDIIIFTLIAGVFCAIGCLACLVPASRPITLRLIGGTVFLGCLGYVIGMAMDGPLLANSRGEPSLLNAFVAFTVIGLPCGYAAIRGRYPRWGRFAEVFGADSPRHPESAVDRSVTEP
jgi:hypothetical protein